MANSVTMCAQVRIRVGKNVIYKTIGGFDFSANQIIRAVEKQMEDAREEIEGMIDSVDYQED